MLLVPALAVAQPVDDQNMVVKPPSEAEPQPVPGVEELEPPPPVWMPELTARSQLNVSLLFSTAIFVNLVQATVYGSYALGDLEVGAEIRARVWREIFDEQGASQISNLKLTARYNATVGKLTISPALTLWAPSMSGEMEHWNELARMSAVDDTRAFIDEGALGIGLAAAYRSGAGFIQAEGGAALVQDDGTQVASIFAAAGLGRQYKGGLAFMGEWRSEWFPMDQRLMSFGFAMLMKRGDNTLLRFRFHPYLFEEEWGGIAAAVDLLRRFQ